MHSARMQTVQRLMLSVVPQTLTGLRQMLVARTPTLCFLEQAARTLMLLSPVLADRMQMCQRDRRACRMQAGQTLIGQILMLERLVRAG